MNLDKCHVKGCKKDNVAGGMGYCDEHYDLHHGEKGLNNIGYNKQLLINAALYGEVILHIKNNKVRVMNRQEIIDLGEHYKNNIKE